MDLLPASSVVKAARVTLDARGCHLAKDAKTTLQRAASIFVVYLATAAHDAARDGKRSTLAVKDVLRALEDVEMGEFAASVTAVVDAARAKAAASKPVAKRRRADGGAAEAAADDGAADVAAESAEAAADDGAVESAEGAADAAGEEAADEAM